MKILVTGGTGFVGSNLTPRLRELFQHPEHEVWTCSRLRVPSCVRPEDSLADFVYHTAIGDDRIWHCQPSLKHYQLDLSYAPAVESMMERLKPDAVVHLAANAIGRADSKDPWRVWQDNVVSTHHLLHNAIKGCRFIFSSSIVVYGTPHVVWPSPSEEDRTFPTSVYGTTKLACENLINIYNGLGDIRGVNLRFPAMVGRGLTHGVVKAFVDKLYTYDDVLTMIGDCPGSVKPYLHVDDAIDMIILMLTEKLDYSGTVNVCPDDELSIDELADVVMSGIDIQKPKSWLGSEANWATDNPILKASNGLAKVLGWNPQYLHSSKAIAQAVKTIHEEES